MIERGGANDASQILDKLKKKMNYVEFRSRITI
jgi:hypothetical protein